VIRDNATTLNRLISELSELAKLETRDVQPTLEAFSVAELVHDVVMSFDPIAGEKNITLRTDFPKNVPAAQADLGLIERVLGNLIRNAIQYTDPGGSIDVNLKHDDGSIRVSVTDTGCGIAAEEIPLVKERFYRVDKSRSSGLSGMGLGLSISEMILNLHGSTLEIESEPKKGSSLSFCLPCVG
jgi:signal transduction histidine kinase